MQSGQTIRPSHSCIFFPYWDFSDGLPCDVRVCSNAPRVELFKDGVSMGAYDIDHKHGKELTANYIIPYEKGELKAVAYDENGNIIAEDMQRSFGDAVRIEAVPDKTEILADGSDLVYIEISAFDKDGTFCANANNRVNAALRVRQGLWVLTTATAQTMTSIKAHHADFSQEKCLLLLVRLIRRGR